MEKEMEKSDGNLFRSDEENQKEQVEGGGLDSEVRTGNSDMEVENEVLTRMSSKGPYLVLPNRDTTPVTLMGHYLTWRPNLPYPACSSHCLI